MDEDSLAVAFYRACREASEARAERDAARETIELRKELSEEKKRADAFSDALKGQYNVEANLKEALKEAREARDAAWGRCRELERERDIALREIERLRQYEPPISSQGPETAQGDANGGDRKALR